MLVKRLLLSAVTVFGITASPAVLAETLVIGALSDNLKKEIARHDPLTSYLEEVLADVGITKVEPQVITSLENITHAIASGQVHVMFDSPLIAARVAREADAKPFVRRWKDQTSSYQSLIVVPVDSGIETLADLLGKRIGFQAPDSTSGFMLPADMIQSKGLAMHQLSSHADTPKGDEVGFVFTGDDKNSIAWLYKGWIEAAATDPRHFALLESAEPGKFRAIARSIEVPRHVGIHCKSLRPEVVARLTEVLLAMDTTKRGREVMEAFNETTRFDAFPDGIEATFAPIYDVLDRLSANGIL